MKHEIIKTDNYLLIVEETNVPKIGKWYYNSDNGNLFVIVNDYPIPKSDIVISHLPLNGSPILKGVDLLPSLEEDDVEKLAREYAHNSATTNYEEGINVGKYQGYIEGYNKAKEKYKYTNENMLVIRNQVVTMLPVGDVTSWDMIQAISKYIKWFDDYIESLSQPKMPIGFELQIGVCERWLNEDCTDNCCGIPEKKITTTTPEGHTQWVGAYIYN